MSNIRIDVRFSFSSRHYKHLLSKRNRSAEIKISTHLMLMRYCANATESGLPEIVMVLSELPLSRSSQFEMRIIAPEICRISAILVPPLPMMQPISSFGTVMLCVWWFWLCCCWFLDAVRNCEPANAANAGRTKSLRALWKGWSSVIINHGEILGRGYQRHV